MRCPECRKYCKNLDSHHRHHHTPYDALRKALADWLITNGYVARVANSIACSLAKKFIKDFDLDDVGETHE